MSTKVRNSIETIVDTFQKIFVFKRLKKKAKFHEIQIHK